jgi:sugar/nucleoside kinase (ribokinase family)
MKRALFVGLTVLDVIYVGLHEIALGGKVEAREKLLRIGGPAANAALTCADLGTSSILATALGPEPLGQHVRREIERRGVEVIDLADDRFQLPIAAVIVDEKGTRTIVSDLPSEQRPRADERLLAAASMATALLVDGHYPLLALPAIANAEKGKRVFDLGFTKPWTKQLLEGAEIVIASSDYQRPHQPSIPDILSGNVELVAVTDGANPITWAQRGGKMKTMQVPQVEVVDTNGAGDVFHGAFVHEIVTGSQPEAALKSATAVASQSCTQIGIDMRWPSSETDLGV